MLKRRAVPMFIVAIILALGAAWMANNWVQARLQPADSVNSKPVVVAALAIPFGDTIEAADIRVTNWPVANLPQGSIADPAEVEGKIARSGIFPGEPILAERIADHLGGSALAAIIEPSKRAITVRVNDVIGVAGFLLPGNRVDVLATKKVGRDAKTKTILQDIKVLAVDQTASPDKDKPVVVRAVTLEMTPPQAEILARSKEEGTLQLTLRNPVDEEKIVKKAAAPKPAKRTVRGTGYRNVTVIRGTAVSNTTVSK